MSTIRVRTEDGIIRYLTEDGIRGILRSRGLTGAGADEMPLADVMWQVNAVNGREVWFGDDDPGPYVGEDDDDGVECLYCGEFSADDTDSNGEPCHVQCGADAWADAVMASGDGWCF